MLIGSLCDSGCTHSVGFQEYFYQHNFIVVKFHFCSEINLFLFLFFLMNGKIISLLIYSDDLVLISRSSDGLQKGLDALKLVCESRHLIVNTAKSKYMLVTKKRRHDQPIMVYNNKHLQSVENFTYLGVNFSRNNSFTKGLKERSRQIYQSQSVLLIYDNFTLKHSSASHIFELFDCLLKPKLLYGCEIWGNGSYKSLELYHTRFIKKTLDIKSTTNTSMIYAETGRFPLASDINLEIIKYWLNIVRMENTSYVKLVYNEMFQNPTKHEWIKYVKTLLCSSGFSGVWEQQLVHDERKFMKDFEQRCRDMYININKKVRTSFTKFRLSSHKLLVERGRWSISKLDYELRKCTLCNSGDIEDEYHVTLVCEQFTDARRKYFKKYFYRRPSMAKFLELMNTKSDRERYRLMLFVNIVLKEHENIHEQR